MYRLPCVLMPFALAVLLCAPAWAQSPFPVAPFPLPFRPAAGTHDLHALYANPAGLGDSHDVELGWFHHFTRRGTGGNNAVVLRLKTAAGAISWIEDPVLGNRREYVVGFGHQLSPKFQLGTSYRYIKADDSGLQNTHVWTHSLLFRSSPLWAVGVRWENPWGAEVGGAETDWRLVSGVTVCPPGDRLTVSVDWVHSEEESLGDGTLIFSGLLHAARGIDLAAFGGTHELFGIELRFLVERSSGGTEVRFADSGGWQDGTFYFTLLQREYDNAALPRGAPRTMPDWR